MSEDIEVLVSGRTEGTVQAEILVLRLFAGRIGLVGPCGPDPWYVEVPDDEDPVRGGRADVPDQPRRAPAGALDVVAPFAGRYFSYIRCRNARHFLPTIAGVPVRRTEMARSDPTAAPRLIDPGQVIEHGLRHLQWLAGDDSAVRRTLSIEWKSVLQTYQPEPFRHLRS